MSLLTETLQGVPAGSAVQPRQWWARLRTDSESMSFRWTRWRRVASAALLLLLAATVGIIGFLPRSLVPSASSHATGGAARTSQGDRHGTGGLDHVHLSALAALATFTGRTLQTVAHPLGDHASFSALTCAGVANSSSRLGGLRTSAACICSPAERIPDHCFPRFNRADLAQSLPPVGDADPGPLQRPLNVVVISIDTARWDVFPFNGPQSRPPALASGTNAIELLRHINHAAHPGVVFRNAFATAPWTLPSHASLLSGFPPDATGTFDDDHMIKVPLLGHHLGDTYCRVAYVSNPNLVHDDPPRPTAPTGDAAKQPQANEGNVASLADTMDGMRTFGWNGSQGWDHYQYFRLPVDAEAANRRFLRIRAGGTDVPTEAPVELPAAQFPACAHNLAQPFFLFAHTNRLHDYGLDPRRYLELTDEADRVIAALLDDVDFNTTVVVLTSDHGEGFEPNLGRLIHTGRVHQDLIHANLVVWHPHHRALVPAAAAGAADDALPTDARLVHDGPVSLVSVVPTLLTWTGHSVPPYLHGAGVLPFPDLAAVTPRAAGGAPIVTPTLPASAIDLSYAFALVANGPHSWLAPFDILVTPQAKNWNRRHIVADDVEIRMTVRWPLKLITSRINGVFHYAAYNLTADSNEVTNLLGEGLLPRPVLGMSSGTEGAGAPPALGGMADFYARMGQLSAALAGCPSLHRVGVMTLEQFLETETLPEVKAAAMECAEVASILQGTPS